jgi:hypothetical protein
MTFFYIPSFVRSFSGLATLPLSNSVIFATAASAAFCALAATFCAPAATFCALAARLALRRHSDYVQLS